MADEKKFYNPPQELVKASNIMEFMEKHKIKDLDELLKRSQDQDWYWGEVAKDLDWFKPWDKVLEWNLPFAKWFVGGKINIAANARYTLHVKSGGRYSIRLSSGETAYLGTRIAAERLASEKNKLTGAS
jgi:acetyl-CoA synthetase